MEWTTYQSIVWTIMQKKKNSDTFANLSEWIHGCLATFASYRSMAAHFECRFIEKQHIHSSELFLVGLWQLISSADSLMHLFSITQNKVSIGICIRNDQGRFVLAKTWRNSTILCIEVCEVLMLNEIIDHLRNVLLWFVSRL
jgi:hypothetical protein